MADLPCNDKRLIPPRHDTIPAPSITTAFKRMKQRDCYHDIRQASLAGVRDDLIKNRSGQVYKQ